MAITDQTAIESYMLLDIDSSFSAQVTEWIAGIEQYMNDYVDRTLVIDAATPDSPYLYNGTGKRGVMIDDFVSISKVEIKSDFTASFTDITTDAFYYPANSTPKWKVESTRLFPRGHQNVRITGKQGYTTSDKIPADLKLAATILVAGVINYSNKYNGEISAETIGRYNVQYTTNAQKKDYELAMRTLDGYLRVR